MANDDYKEAKNNKILRLVLDFAIAYGVFFAVKRIARYFFGYEIDGFWGFFILLVISDLVVSLIMKKQNKE